MCGRYYNRRQKQQIAEQMRASTVFDPPYAPDYNIAPMTFQPIVRQMRDTDDRELVLARWGLVPFFAKSLAEFKGFSTFNARSESVATSETLCGPFKTRRCLVPADGFYEWKTLDNRKKSGKQPYAIHLKSGEALAFAGLWDAWKELRNHGKMSTPGCKASRSSRPKPMRSGPRSIRGCPSFFGSATGNAGSTAIPMRLHPTICCGRSTATRCRPTPATGQ